MKRVIEDLHTQLGMITVSLGLAVGTYFADIWVAAGLFALLGAFLYWRLSKKLMGIGDHFGTSQLQASRITVMEERVASSRYCPDCGCVSCFATMEYVCREDLTSLLAPHTRAGNPEWELPARDFWRRQANDVKK